MKVTMTMDITEEPEEKVRPVVQRGGEVVLEPLGGGLHVGNARKHRGEPVDVGGHGVEDQVAQPRQDGECHNVGGTEQRAGDECGHDHCRCAAAPAFDDAGQPADIGTVDDRHESAHPGDQKRDDATGDGRGDQHPKPVPVGKQTHRHGAQQRQPGRKRDDDRNDRGGRAQRRHHRGLCKLDRLKRAGPPRGARLGHGHFSILPVAT